MSTSLTTRTILGLMPLAIGILLRHYYDKVLKDKTKGKNRDESVPLHIEELMYDEAFTLIRVSFSSLLLVCLNPQSIQSTELHGLGNKVCPFHIIHSSTQQSCECSDTVEELQKFANLHTPAESSSHVRLTVPQISTKIMRGPAHSHLP